MLSVQQTRIAIAGKPDYWMGQDAAARFGSAVVEPPGPAQQLLQSRMQSCGNRAAFREHGSYYIGRGGETGPAAVTPSR